jgi:hypothetical protein
VPYRLSDLARVIEDGMGTLNKPEGATAYRQILARLQSVREDPRYGFMFQSIYCATISTPSSGGSCACRWRTSR